MSEFAGKRVTVAGLGRFGGGIAAARWLVNQGARVLVTDREKREKLADSIAQLDGVDVEFRLGEHRKEDFANADLVVASPAIPPGNGYLCAARQAGVPVTTEMRLFVERCPARIVGITGTKGKSTTTTMIRLMLAKRYKTWLGGNIGVSLLGELGKISANDLVILELSSFMLHYLREIEWSPHVAVITLLSADHLEWHGSLEAYRLAKRTIVDFQTAGDFVVVNEQCPACLEFVATTRARVIAYGVEKRKAFKLMVPGAHNQLNAQAAFAAASALDVSWDEAQAAVADFAGLPHRLQLVHEAHGVKFYDDSIATIPEAAVLALVSFPARKVIQIVGGYDHHLPTVAMCGALADRAKAVLCIGATGPALHGQLEKSPGVAVYNCGDLPTAMKQAREIAQSGDVVLLSTGYKSFDQFTNYQERGHMFARLAREMWT